MCGCFDAFYMSPCAMGIRRAGGLGGSGRRASRSGKRAGQAGGSGSQVGRIGCFC